MTFRLLASEKIWPPNHRATVQVWVATDQQTLEGFWSYLQFQTGLPSVAWERELVLFLFTGESRYCAVEVREIRFQNATGYLTVHVAIEREERLGPQPDGRLSLATWPSARACSS